MKIVIATGIYPPDIGGPATYIPLLEKEFPKRGFDIEVVTYGPAGVSRKIPGGLRHLIYFFTCLFKAFNSDIVFAQNQVSAGLPAMLAAKIAGCKFIIRIAGDSAWEQAVLKYKIKDNIDDFQNKKYGTRVEFRRKIQKFVVDSTDAIITPSIYFKRVVSKWMKSPNKVHVIYNGIKLIDSKKFISNEKKSKTIFSVGRLVPWKGFDVLIELMADLSDWRLVIIGDGPDKKRLSKIINSLHLKKKVELMGSMPREKLIKHLTKAKIFVLNTSFESFSFQVVEAMNVGVPVIVTNIGSLPEIVDDGREGILVEPNNKKQIIKAVKKIEKDRHFRKTIIDNARKKIQRFALKNMTESLEKLLKSL